MAESKLELTPVRCGCGGEAKIETVTTRFEQVPRFRIRCEKCNISTIWNYFAKDDAIEAWNRAMGGVAKNATTECSVQECAENARCSDDLISRQNAIDALMEVREAHKADKYTGDLLHWTGIKAMLENLPSAEPERKKGE